MTTFVHFHYRDASNVPLALTWLATRT